MDSTWVRWRSCKAQKISSRLFFHTLFMDFVIHLRLIWVLKILRKAHKSTGLPWFTVSLKTCIYHHLSTALMVRSFSPWKRPFAYTLIFRANDSWWCRRARCWREGFAALHPRGVVPADATSGLMRLTFNRSMLFTCRILSRTSMNRDEHGILMQYDGILWQIRKSCPWYTPNNGMM